jgi:hypothetical protein
MAPAILIMEPLSSRTVLLDMYSCDYAALGFLVKSLRTILPCDTILLSEQDPSTKVGS